MYTVEDFDKLKQKILKYVFYKKRTEQEIRVKFQNEESDILEDMIEFLKEEKYIDDADYINRSINEFMSLKNLSLKEIKYKLYQKGIDKNLLEDYFNENYETLFNYEINSAKNLYKKKSRDMDEEDIKNFLYKKGYTSESINKIFLDD